MGLCCVSAKNIGVIVGPHLVFATPCITGFPKSDSEIRLANHLVRDNSLPRRQRRGGILIYLMLIKQVVIRESPLHILLNSIVGFKVARTDSVLIISGKDNSLGKSWVIRLKHFEKYSRVRT